MRLVVQIIRFVSPDPQPGIVECNFVDANKETHAFVDNVPISSLNDLDVKSSYPVKGILRCEVMKEWKDDLGRELVRITTRRDGVESTTGLSEFVVLRNQLR